MLYIMNCMQKYSIIYVYCIIISIFLPAFPHKVSQVNIAKKHKSNDQAYEKTIFISLISFLEAPSVFRGKGYRFPDKAYKFSPRHTNKLLKQNIK